MSGIKIEFSEILADLRYAKNKMTQKELAEALNLRPSTVSSYERGSNSPKLRILLKIANLFDVSVDYLIGRSNVKMPISRFEELLFNDGEEKITFSEFCKLFEVLPTSEKKKIYDYIKMVNKLREYEHKL